MDWHRVTVEIDAAAVEAISEVLWASGTAGIEERATDDERRVLLIAGFPSPEGAREAAERLAAADAGAVGVEAISDHGLDDWRRWARPMRAGRFAITPPWCDPLDDGSEPLWIDPGHTFGSGSHPTTRLVVTVTQRLVQPGDRVLDVGSGSGVLAVAAARCGAASVTAIDIDPASPAQVTHNAEANGVAAIVHASTTGLVELAEAVTAGSAPYDLVLANLLAPTIVELASPLLTATRPGGELVLSGLLVDQWRPVVHEFDDPAGAPEPQRTTVVEVLEEDGWVAVRLHRGLSR